MESEDLDKFLPLVFDVVDVIRDIFEHAQSSCDEKFSSLTGRQHKTIKAVMTSYKINPEGLSLKELAEALKLSSATTSELVESLVQKDILLRNPCPSDRRAVRIIPTAYTINTIEIGKKAVADRFKGFMDEISTESIDTVCDCLEKIKNNIEK